MTWDVACLGELVMDLVPHVLPDGRRLLAPSPGGAPGNVAAGLARLGLKALMIAKVGDEVFGGEIIATLSRLGVDTSGIRRDSAVKTRLSVVSLAPDGERSFLFYRDTPADAALDAAEIAPLFVQSARILHVGSLLMAAPRAAAAQESAITLAHASGSIVSADPNLRPSLWPSPDAMIAAGRRLVSSAQILKLSADELQILSGCTAIEAGVRALWHDGLKVVAVTKGAQGAELFTSRHRIHHRGFRIKAVDTLAAGDAFMASLLAGLIDCGADTHDVDHLAHVLRRACAAGALAAMKPGAMSSLPDSLEIGCLCASAAENPSQPG